MIAKLLTLFVFGAIASLALAGETYRWEDAQGRVYYSDQPPPPGARNVRKTREFDDDEEGALPYRLQVVVEKAPVTLYATDCGQPCDRARELLITRGVPHTMLDASTPEVQAELQKLTNGRVEVPVVVIGKVVLRGFEEGQWNSALDVAGYPSYAMIDVEPYVPEPTERSDSQGSEDGEVASNANNELEAAEGEIDSDESLFDDDSNGLENEDVDSSDIDQEE